MNRLDEIITWLRRQLDSAGADGFVFGLSGGVDSATAGALAARATDNDRVLGVLMPCHSDPEDARLARRVAQRFDIPTLTVNLTPTYDTLIAHLPPSDHRLAAANVKPRLRMTTLYYLAQSHNYLVLGSGNKSEAMVGYATKWGDTGVDLLPLGALYKTEVWELARHLGVPQEVVERPPSAGLWPGQTDEEELGMTYQELDQALRAIENGEPSDIPAPTLQKVRQMIARSAHKRSTPPVFPADED